MVRGRFRSLNMKILFVLMPSAPPVVETILRSQSDVNIACVTKSPYKSYHRALRGPSILVSRKEISSKQPYRPRRTLEEEEESMSFTTRLLSPALNLTRDYLHCKLGDYALALGYAITNVAYSLNGL